MLTNENTICFGTFHDFDWQIRRNSIGFRCGYISIPKNHPMYGVSCEVKYGENDEAVYSSVSRLSVYGGITHSEFEGDDWVIGFDCVHFGGRRDPLPSTFHPNAMLVRSGNVWTTQMVKEELFHLIEQVVAAK